jgi:hypothetical protein
MLSDKCNLQGLSGIMQLDHVGPYVIITNRWLYEIGESSRYALINEANLWVRSIHGSQSAAVLSAQQHTNPHSAPFKAKSKTSIIPERF